MRPKLDWRAAVTGGALCLAYTCAAAVPSAAPADETQGTPTATASNVAVSDRRMNVRTGRRAIVRGVIQPAGSTVALQIRRGTAGRRSTGIAPTRAAPTCCAIVSAAR